MKETRDEIRARLLRDGNVIENIQFRAYEIWHLRGCVDGRHHEDWALAENEILNFLVELEWKKAAEEVRELVEEVASAENEGMNLVAVPEVEIAVAEAIPEEKTRKAAAPKAKTTKTTTRKKATTAKEGEATESVAKKTAAKTSAAKRTTTKKSASKKSAKTEQPIVK